jgi:hypothetical protein
MGYKSTDTCLKKAAEDEMLFVLRAQDISSPLIVLEWIKQNFHTCNNDKLLEAFECALEMKDWAERKLAD